MIYALVRVQAEISYENNLYFFNLFETMGGQGSMVNWVGQTPALANMDYVHFTRAGSEKVAEYIFNALLKEYNLFEKTGVAFSDFVALL